MNTKPIEQARDADLRGSQAALLRAAQRARQIAAQTGTAIVVVHNGVMEHIYPSAPGAIDREQAATSADGKPV
ncbi:MAG: hypothetical protein P9F19_16890 [Candidatus Contendobacter sp.]|nr:hypothetical protein [Candidatus Contendobacter sp.]MDG4559043.1 hypothetical protein [Candidatus Contendobacter sp.]